MAHARQFSFARGFSLVEIVLVLAVLGILAAVLVPMGLQAIQTERRSAVREDLQTIFTAILGDRKRGVFGYVGDVGNYPASLMDLVRPPTDSSGNALLGWKGRYIQRGVIENGVLLDSYGSPFEYFLLSGADDVPDQLAIISRGPNKVSTNAEANPNLAINFTGLSVADSGYLSDAKNADNAVFPSVDGNPNAVNVVTDGDVALNILNFDNNPKVNAFVPACPELFQITATSVARGVVEANLSYVQGLKFNLTQGHYGITISPQDLATTSWSETVTVQPAATLATTFSLTGLDSSGTPLFNLTVINGLTDTKIEVFEFGAALKSTDKKILVGPGETKVFTPHGCAQIFIKGKGKGFQSILDQFVMPYGDFLREEGTEAATLTVSNLHGHNHHDHDKGHLHHHDGHHHRHHGHHRLLVFRNGILLGTVNHHKTKAFKDLRAGDAITIKDRQDTLLGGLTLSVGSNTIAVT